LLKPEDFNKIEYDFFREQSKDVSLIVRKLPNGNLLITGIKRDNKSVRKTESGEIVLSEEGLKKYEEIGPDYLFIPEGSHDKEEA
jgi:hypothetical protein